jgi:hypothetical protein
VDNGGHFGHYAPRGDRELAVIEERCSSGEADGPPQRGSAFAASSQPEATPSTLGHGSHGDGNCALNGMLDDAQFVVVGDRLVVDGEVRFEGSWTVAATGARWPETSVYQEVRAPRDGETLPFRLEGWNAPDGEVGDRVLALIGNGLSPEAGPAVVAIATTTPAIAILGECGQVWNAAIASVAGTDDATAIAELLMMARATRGSEPMNATMLAIDDAQAGVPSGGLAWATQDPSVRSLSPFDIPPSDRSRFLYSVVEFGFGPMEPGGEPWKVRMSTSEGLAFNVVISGAGGPVEVGVPKGSGAGVLEIVNPSGEVVSSIDRGTKWIDPELGARIEVSAGQSGEPQVISYSPLADGDLEKLLGMTRSEIDQLRAEIYAGQFPVLSDTTQEGSAGVVGG